MTVLKTTFGLFGTAAVIAAIPVMSAVAQTQSPAPAETTPPPAVTKPETTMPPAQRQVMPPTAIPDKTVAAPSKMGPAVGLAIVSSDGSKLGTVQTVKMGADGKVEAILLKTGGFLGFGGKLVAIPASKYARSGDTLNLSITADDVSKLPEANEPK